MWSKIRKQLNDLTCDALKNRVDFHASNYRMHEGIGRTYITVDGKEVYNMCSLRRDYYGDKKEGVYAQEEFGEAIQSFTNSPFDEMIHSDNTLIKILVLLDRRLGKRRLADLKTVVEKSEDIVKFFYKLRCDSEGLTLKDDAM